MIIILSLISIVMLTRTFLMVAGLLKNPFLRRFEKYGDEEEFLQLSTPLLGWGGLFLISSNALLTEIWNYDTFMFGLGGLMIALGLLAYERPDLIGHRFGLILIYPRWLHELASRTTRLERRRLAYMWMHLPPKLRLIYNSNDRAFLEWADMVILGTIM